MDHEFNHPDDPHPLLLLGFVVLVVVVMIGIALAIGARA